MTIRRIHISPTWSFHDDLGNTLDPQLFILLNGINQTGKLTAATKLADISYRHAWNLINNAGDFFGSKLAILEKGRGAQLTPLGEQLVWAEQRVAARLKPQMENLASELNIEIHRQMADSTPLLRLHASHGYAVSLLPDFANSFQLDLQYKSANEALASLNRNACDIAGIHIPAEIHIKPLLDNYNRYLKPRAHKVIRFITRQQGLMIQTNNPKAIESLDDLVRTDVKFINRQKDSGTRALLDKLLSDKHIATTAINGYEEQEFTHSAVAAFVAAGMADAGFGVEAAARQFGLGFIPMTTEHYLMICHEKALKRAATLAFLQMIRSDEFQQKVETLAGYSAQDCGNIELLGEGLMRVSIK